jgi:hypothetical protein
MAWAACVMAAMPLLGCASRGSQSPRAPRDRDLSVAPCDSSVVDTTGWIRRRDLEVVPRVDLLLPPELERTVYFTAGGGALREFRRGDRVITVFGAAKNVTGYNTRGMDSLPRCFRSVGPHMVNIHAGERAGAFVVQAFWTWKGSSGERGLMIAASGPDAAWQRRALAIIRFANVDGVDHSAK